MALLAQFDKICVLSKRQSTVTDEKTGKSNNFLFVTGFDAVNGTVFSDLRLSDSSVIRFDDIWDNRVYNGRFAYSAVNDGKNMRRLSSVELCEVYGDLELKQVKTSKGL